LNKRAKNDFIYFAAVLAVRFLRASSRLTAIRFMRGLGWIAFHLAHSERRKTVEHLSRAFAADKSPARIRAMAKGVFLHFATAAADAIRLPNLIRDDLNRLVTHSGMHYLENALARGNGVIALTAHFGNWELLGAWLAQRGYPLKVVGRRAYDPRLDRMIVETRNQCGYTNITRGAGTREIIRTLRRGQILGMLIDQDTRVEGVFVDFFNQPAHTATGPVELARKFGSPIVPIFLRLRNDLTYRIECQEPMELVSSGDEKRDLHINTQKCSHIYENIIKRYPEQWAWMHERWKKKPALQTSAPVDAAATVSDVVSA